MVCKYLLPVYRLSFHPLNELSFAKQKVFLIIKSNLSVSSVNCAFGVKCKTSLCSSGFYRFSPIFLSKSLLALCFILKSMINFELLFCKCEA